MTDHIETIARSISLHPTLYRDAMRNYAEEHATHAGRTHHPRATSVARSLARVCFEVADMIDNGETANDICRKGWDHTISAFAIACRLQCIPPNVMRDMMPVNLTD